MQIQTLKNKKGMLGDLKPAVIILGMAIILIVIVIAILGSVKTSQETTANFNAINESITALHGVNVSFAHNNLVSFGTAYSSGKPINSNNYTIYLPQGYFKLNNASINNTAVLVNYVYPDVVHDAVYNTTEKGITSISKFMDWMPILVIIVVAVIILGLIGAFGGKSERRR